MSTISSSSSSASASSIVSSQYAFEMAKAWRTDNVAQDPMKGDMFGRPELVRAPSQAFTAPAAPVAPPAAAPVVGPSSADILTFLQTFDRRQEERLGELSGRITKLTDEVSELRGMVSATNKQVSNLVSMGFCDKLKTLSPCCNHLKSVSVRGLTAKELELVEKSKTIQLQGAK
jgi:hypothetical protein